MKWSFLLGVCLMSTILFKVNAANPRFTGRDYMNSVMLAFRSACWHQLYILFYNFFSVLYTVYTHIHTYTIYINIYRNDNVYIIGIKLVWVIESFTEIVHSKSWQHPYSSLCLIFSLLPFFLHYAQTEKVFSTFSHDFPF